MIESAFGGSCEPPDESAINDFVRFDDEPGKIWEDEDEEEEE